MCMKCRALGLGSHVKLFTLSVEILSGSMKLSARLFRSRLTDFLPKLEISRTSAGSWIVYWRHKLLHSSGTPPLEEDAG